MVIISLFAVQPVLSAQTTFSFNAPRDYVAGSYPQSLVVGNFNTDNLPDIAVANEQSNNISVFLQNTGGTFQAAVNYPTGNTPVSLQQGDFNNDSKQDLILLNQADNTFGVLLGNGDGTFQTQKLTTISGVTALQNLVVGDFNGDGKLDVAIAVSLAQVGTYGIAVFLGNGDGTFQAEINYPVNATMFGFGLQAADFNNDGKLDLAVATSTGVAVLLGNGNGTFQSPVSTSISAAPLELVVADFNQDGKLDIATSAMYPGGGPSTATMLLGNGDGTFQVTTFSDLFDSPLAAGDLNGDGLPDIVATNAGAYLTVLVNGGNNTFTQESVNLFGPQLLGGDAIAVLADLTGNQKLDLVIGSPEYLGLITVAFGNGNGTFTTASPYALPSSSTPDAYSAIATGDFNNDGKIDLAAGLTANDEGIEAGVAIFLNNGMGFSAPNVVLFGSGGSATNVYPAVGDFNGDGVLDLAVASTDIAILLGNGDGTFQSPVPYGQNMGGPIAVGDFNNDGKLDVVGINPGAPGTVSVLLGNGDGTFGIPVNSSTGNSNSTVLNLATGDFNADGNLDLVILEHVNSGYLLQVLLGNGDGTFTPGNSYTLPSGIPNSIVVGDFNDNGVLDLAVGFSGLSSEIAVYLGAGNGSFGSPIITDTWNGASALAVADFNLDGKADLAANTTDLSVLLGNGNGTFQPAVQYNSFGFDNSFLATADFDGNGSPDIAASGADGISVFYNSASGPAATVAPADVSFENEGLGYTSPAHVVTLSNTGAGALNITSITFSGLESGDYSQSNNCGTSLAAGVNCSINVTFTPGAAGLRTASLQIADNAFNSPQTIPLSGTGATPAAGGSASPQQLTFGNQYVGSASSAQVVTLTSSGNVPLSITSITVTGPQATDFSETNTCGSSVPNESICTISMSFTPAAVGNRSATLEITDNASNSPLSIPLSGTGVGSSVGLGPGSGSSSATVAAGQTANYTLSIGGAGMSGNATLACTGAPQGAMCSVPSSILVSGSSASPVNVSVSTTLGAMASFHPNVVSPHVGTWAIVVVGMLMLSAWKADFRRRCLGAIIVILGTLLMFSCSNGSRSSYSGGTPPGQYSLSVTATLNSSTQSVTLTLIVQ